jgi:hypothetical protein
MVRDPVINRKSSNVDELQKQQISRYSCTSRLRNSETCAMSWIDKDRRLD